jgi:hypothetical protein
VGQLGSWTSSSDGRIGSSLALKAGSGAESRCATAEVRADVGAIRLESKQRATPHPALRATFPSKLEKDTAEHFGVRTPSRADAQSLTLHHARCRAEFVARFDAPPAPNDRLRRTMTTPAPWE